MPESGTYGSVRGVPSNGHPYRDWFLSLLARHLDVRIQAKGTATSAHRFNKTWDIAYGGGGVSQHLYAHQCVELDTARLPCDLMQNKRISGEGLKASR
jgi:hypothetical protein